MKAFVLAMVMAGTCWGQATQPDTIDQERIDAAMARLAQKQQHPPSVLDQIAAMRREITELKAQIAKLTAENAQLRQQSAPTNASATRELKIGMTLTEANATMGHTGQKFAETVTSASYEWRFEGAFEGGRYVGDGARYYAEFQDGKLIRTWR